MRRQANGHAAIQEAETSAIDERNLERFAVLEPTVST
jgi:hypothetical protein